MIIKATSPCRISMFGGGTDTPEFTQTETGLVISLAINLYQSVTLYTQEDSLDIKHDERPLNGTIEFMDAIFNYFEVGNAVRYVSKSDALLNSGLGASAAAAVATIGALNKALKLNGGRAEIAEKAWLIETSKAGLYGGRQDQYATAFGGFNAIVFDKEKIEVNPLALEMVDNLLPSLVLLHTGETRTNTKIQEGFKQLSSEQTETLIALRTLAEKSLEPLAQGDIEKVGSLLASSWELKKKSNNGVTNSHIDKLYDKALSLGAYGGKTCGAGGGGYMLFIVNPSKREDFITQMGLEYTDFEPCMNGLSTRIL